MLSLADLVLSDGEAVEAVGWLGGLSTPRSLQVSPSWRRDRPAPVQGGSIDVYFSDDAEASDVDEAALVRVVGEWGDDAIHRARLALGRPLEDVGGKGGRTPEGPPGSHLTSPSSAENAVLERLLTAGDISWQLVYGYPDGRRAVRVGSDRRAAIQDELTMAFPGGVEFSETLWSKAELTNALGTLSEHRDAWHVVATGGGFRGDADGVFGISVEVLHVDPDFAAWADALPPDLLDVTALVRPAPVEGSLG